MSSRGAKKTSSPSMPKAQQPKGTGRGYNIDKESGNSPSFEKKTTTSNNSPSSSVTNKSSPFEKRKSGPSFAASPNLQDRLLYLIVQLVGQHVQVQVRDGSWYSGILHTFDPASKSLGFVLKMASKIDKDVRGKDEPLMTAPIETLLIMPNDFIQLSVADVCLNSTPEKSEFATDSEISRRSIKERELVPWMDPGSGQSLALDFNSKEHLGWDQFNGDTSFKEEFYTTPLDRTSEDYRSRVAEATKIAREIEHSLKPTNAHMLEERGIELGDVDEEELYGAVKRDESAPIKRDDSAPPAAVAPTTAGQSSTGKYQPPYRRKDENGGIRKPSQHGNTHPSKQSHDQAEGDDKKLPEHRRQEVNSFKSFSKDIGTKIKPKQGATGTAKPTDTPAHPQTPASPSSQATPTSPSTPQTNSVSAPLTVTEGQTTTKATTPKTPPPTTTGNTTTTPTKSTLKLNPNAQEFRPMSADAPAFQPGPSASFQMDPSAAAYPPPHMFYPSYEGAMEDPHLLRYWAGPMMMQPAYHMMPNFPMGNHGYWPASNAWVNPTSSASISSSMGGAPRGSYVAKRGGGSPNWRGGGGHHVASGPTHGHQDPHHSGAPQQGAAAPISTNPSTPANTPPANTPAANTPTTAVASTTPSAPQVPANNSSESQVVSPPEEKK